MLAHMAMDKVLEADFETVIDVGSGKGVHASLLRQAGKDVTTVSLTPPADIVGNVMYVPIDVQYDVVWASHVLEHQPNINNFLARLNSLLKDDGLLAITVPPMKPEIVGGHVSLWNAGLLLYNLVLAGFDCSDAKVKTYGYNISVLVRKQPADLHGVGMCGSDIELLARYFPMPVQQGFNGNIGGINW